MSNFSSYEKMPTSLKKLGLSESEYAKLDKLQWVVTEKVHGANFSFIYEHKTLKYAKRKELLSWKDDFFGFQLVVAKMESQVIKLFEQLSSEIDGDKYIMYGELFGGGYPQLQVVKEEKVQAIQTGVYYSPTINFMAFDIAIEKESVKYYLSYESAIRYFKIHQIVHAQPLLIAKFGEALSFNTRINSTIPKMFSLPELINNLIEGVVIKPYNQKKGEVFSNRPIIKLKNPEFEEDNKYHDAEKWSYIPSISSKTEDLSYIVDELRNYITPNRLESAISKIGALDVENIERISAIEQEFLLDTIADFNEDNNNILKDFTPDENKWIKDRVSTDITKLITMSNDEQP
jgi:Rnl2 family RNA ligase